MAESNVLTRDQSIPNGVAPNGRKLGIVKDEYNPGLLKIAFVDDKGGVVPDELSGHYTKRAIAGDAIKSYLTRFWDQSDRVSKKN